MDKIECTVEGAGKVIEEKPVRNTKSKERNNEPKTPDRFIV